MDEEIKKRLGWIKLYQETGDAGLTCRKCGISRPTLRKGVKRYEEQGEVGLAGLSRKPKRSPSQKVQMEQEQWILTLRCERRLWVRRIQHELVRLHDCHLSLATIQKVLNRNKVAPLQRPPAETKAQTVRERFAGRTSPARYYESCPADLSIYRGG